MTPLLLRIPVQTKNPNNGQTGNSRLAAIIRRKQYVAARDFAAMVVTPAIRAALPSLRWPLVVTLTRLSSSPRGLDDDGLAGALKGPRDSVARALGVDDGDRTKVRFVYENRKCKRGEYGIEVRVEAAEGRRETA